MSEARGDVLAFTDADCIPQPDWLREGVAALADADLIQGAVIPDPRMERRPFDRTVTVRREYGLYETANLFVTRELFSRIGGFEDWLPARIGKPLAEDVWFGWKARRAGARIGFSEPALVHHAVFRRSWPEYARDRARVVYFPAMVERVPELREAFLHRRFFLTPRTAKFDLGVAAAGVAWAAGHASRRRWLPLMVLLGAVPYVATLADALRWGRRGPLVLAGELTADVIGCIALAWGSIHRRTPVL